MCPDMQTDNLFIHEVTVMPGVGGAFQYLGNRITQQGEQEADENVPSGAPAPENEENSGENRKSGVRIAALIRRL